MVSSGSNGGFWCGAVAAAMRQVLFARQQRNPIFQGITGEGGVFYLLLVRVVFSHLSADCLRASWQNYEDAFFRNRDCFVGTLLAMTVNHYAR